MSEWKRIADELPSDDMEYCLCYDNHTFGERFNVCEVASIAKSAKCRDGKVRHLLYVYNSICPPHTSDDGYWMPIPDNWIDFDKSKQIDSDEEILVKLFNGSIYVGSIEFSYEFSPSFSGFRRCSIDSIEKYQELPKPPHV